MTDLKNIQDPQHRSPRRLSGKTVTLLIAGVVVLALIAVLGVVMLRPDGDSGAGGAGVPAKSTNVPDTPSAGSETSAATILGWGKPASDDEFSAPLGPGWDVYNGVGHDGNGRRSPDAVSVSDGLLTITGDSDGATAGMAWVPGRKYGRWEGRVRAPASDPTYNALMLLWPDAEDWPVGGEVDFTEMDDPSRQSTKGFLHYGTDNTQEKSEVTVDATQWHNWAVEWTPDHVAYYLDGRQWYRSTDISMLPPRPMHLAIQLDWFPENGDGNNVKKSTMQVDWVKEYALPGYQ